MKEQKKPTEEQKRELPEVLTEQFAELDDSEQHQVLGFVQGIAYAKLTSKPA